MEKTVLYTTSYDDTIESISDICCCSVDKIKNYLKHSQPFYNTSVENIKLNSFFREIGIQFIGNNELYEIIKFDSCVISHLTSRINEPNKSNIYNLSKALSVPTDISKFLANKGLTFEKTIDGLVTYHNNEIVDWNSFENCFIPRIKLRLGLSNEYTDNCINGFLFNDLFWEYSDVEHIKECPEIVSDICDVLDRDDIVHEWKNTSKPYAVGFLTDVKDIIFDKHTNFNTTKSKIYLIYKYVMYYLIQNYHGIWNPRFDNVPIRLSDDCSIDKDNIIGFYEIEE